MDKYYHLLNIVSEETFEVIIKRINSGHLDHCAIFECLISYKRSDKMWQRSHSLLNKINPYDIDCLSIIKYLGSNDEFVQDKALTLLNGMWDGQLDFIKLSKLLKSSCKATRDGARYVLLARGEAQITKQMLRGFLKSSNKLVAERANILNNKRIAELEVEQMLRLFNITEEDEKTE